MEHQEEDQFETTNSRPSCSSSGQDEEDGQEGRAGNCRRQRSSRALLMKKQHGDGGEQHASRSQKLSQTSKTTPEEKINKNTGRSKHPSSSSSTRRTMKMNMATTLVASMAVLVLLGISGSIGRVHSLECIQCDRKALWYSPEENERHIARCQRALIPATRCANASHTHCIFNYYKQGGVITVTERSCGMAEDITGCTLYKSTTALMRARRHLIAGAGVDAVADSGLLWRGGPSGHQHPPSHRRRETNPLVVEVCTGGCEQDGCVSGTTTTTGRSSTTMLVMVMVGLLVGWIWTTTGGRLRLR